MNSAIAQHFNSRSFTLLDNSGDYLLSILDRYNGWSHEEVLYDIVKDVDVFNKSLGRLRFLIHDVIIAGTEGGSLYFIETRDNNVRKQLDFKQDDPTFEITYRSFPIAGKLDFSIYFKPLEDSKFFEYYIVEVGGDYTNNISFRIDVDENMKVRTIEINPSELKLNFSFGKFGAIIKSLSHKYSLIHTTTDKLSDVNLGNVYLSITEEGDTEIYNFFQKPDMQKNIYITRYPSGKIKKISNSVIDFTIELHENGVLRSLKTVFDDKYHAFYLFVNERCEIISEGFYNLGNKVGLWKEDNTLKLYSNDFFVFPITIL